MYPFKKDIKDLSDNELKDESKKAMIKWGRCLGKSSTYYMHVYFDLWDEAIRRKNEQRKQRTIE